MQLSEALQFEALRRAQVVAGGGSLSRAVRWVHVVDLPDPAAWVRPGMLLLTTGYAWPRAEAAQRALARALAEREIAAVGLAVPQFFEHFPAAMRAEAERAGLPLIEIPWEVPFAQIAEELLQALVVDQYHQIERAEANHRALTRAAVEAESLQDLASALGTLLTRAVTIEDAEGRLLAAHRDPALADELRRSTVEQGRTPPEYEAALERTGLARVIATSHGPLRIPAMPELGATGRVVCPIMLKRELVGRTWIIEGARPLSEIDLRAAEQAALIAALHILHQRELEMREARLGYAFLDSLLAGDFALTPQASARALLLGYDPAGSYHAARAEFLDELLGPLRQARHGAELLASLTAYACHGFRLARAAKSLYIHPKTLAYRLQRVATLTGLSPADPETRFRLQLAAQMLALGE